MAVHLCSSLLGISETAMRLPALLFGILTVPLSAWLAWRLTKDRRVSLIVIALSSFSTALVYYFGPNRRQEFRHVFPGAVLATILWLMATLAFGWYVRNIANYNVLYGSVGAGLALLVWMYVLAAIVLFGCEFNAVRERP